MAQLEKHGYNYQPIKDFINAVPVNYGSVFGYGRLNDYMKAVERLRPGRYSGLEKGAYYGLQWLPLLPGVSHPGRRSGNAVCAYCGWRKWRWPARESGVAQAGPAVC